MKQRIENNGLVLQAENEIEAKKIWEVIVKDINYALNQMGELPINADLMLLRGLIETRLSRFIDNKELWLKNDS